MSQALRIPRAAAPITRLAGLQAALASRIMARLGRGSLDVTLPNGARLAHRAALPGPEASVVLHRWRALRRLVLGGDIAFAEAYGDGDWSSPDLAKVVELAAVNGPDFEGRLTGTPLARLLNRLLHLRRPNSRSGSARNIIAHYDLGNDFFSAWLDAGMSYSSGLYDTGSTTLDDAQRAKQDRAIALLDLRGGESVLEIGIGWGGLAERILQAHDGTLTGVTLSPSQLAHAQDRLLQAGLAGRAQLRLQDYRDVPGRFDRIVSIEMLEAVGEAYWPTYFRTLRERLNPGGVAVLQVITIAEDRFAGYRRSADFIQRHIFPGGMLPSPSVLREQVAQAGLVLDHEETFGQSYARTLADWHERFVHALPDVARCGLDERFQRLWRYYLAYCEGGFRAGAIDVGFYRIRRGEGGA
ncbi:SAM-dependent methyltransferase [Neoroseomonas lacus]|uniref:Cyclopropane-fatty-acyl-phospholipid synthase n=1 Tax=Neoroseomonas lacus TaxID=287609 RepID=A0A917K724_9PROT|nr:cyclopropane-fatty-acyl-phospholipid synthase family protein [Neoroseomonas lacus]GGJ01325.1 cyclopropane-fatty-acyl-phospholipid synthase [Neoroseomonas lacus]